MRTPRCMTAPRSADSRAYQLTTPLACPLPSQSVAHALSASLSRSFVRPVCSRRSSLASLVKMSSAWFAVVCLVLAANNLGQFYVLVVTRSSTFLALFRKSLKTELFACTGQLNNCTNAM